MTCQSTHQHNLQTAIDKIEALLESDISIEELAKACGYSRQHFGSLFFQALGMTPQAYIIKRRLQCILYRHTQGEKLIELLLSYGFDTHAGFYKAFKREHGCSIRHYLKCQTSESRLLEPINLSLEAAYHMNKKQIKKLLEYWDLALPQLDSLTENNSVQEITPATNAGGAMVCQHVWHIGNAYILKTTQNVVQLRKHLQISAALDSHGFKGQTAVLTRTGEEIVVFEGRSFALMHRIPGEPLLPKDYLEVDGPTQNAICEAYGIALGELHNALNHLDNEQPLGAICFEDIKEADLVGTVVRWAIPNARRIMSQRELPLGLDLADTFYTEFEARFPRVISEVLETSPLQLIHRDPNPSNILFKDQQVTGFIDFEISERNVRIFDLCYIATGLLSEAYKHPKAKDQWPQMLISIINGYNVATDRKLSAAEWRAIPDVIYGIQLIFIAWLESNEKYPDAAKTNRSMLKWLVDNQSLWASLKDPNDKVDQNA